MRIVWGIFLFLSLFFTVYDFFLGNVFEDPIHPALISFCCFLVGVFFFFSFDRKQKEEKKEEGK